MQILQFLNYELNQTKTLFQKTVVDTLIQSNVVATMYFILRFVLHTNGTFTKYIINQIKQF